MLTGISQPKNNVFFVSESIMMATSKGLKADPWWWPTSTAKGVLVRAANGACSSPI